MYCLRFKNTRLLIDILSYQSPRFRQQNLSDDQYWKTSIVLICEFSRVQQNPEIEALNIFHDDEIVIS